MKQTVHTPVAVSTEHEHRLRKRLALRCAVCGSHVWLNPLHLAEPPDVPGPRKCWVLCRHCYEAVQEEMRRSPLTSSLRTRIAIGLVASDRWPMAYPTRMKSYVYDRRWIVFIASGCVIAMLLHLLLILYIV